MPDWRDRLDVEALREMAQRANPLYRSFQTNFSDYQAIRAKKTLASAIQIGDPVSINRATLRASR